MARKMTANLTREVKKVTKTFGKRPKLKTPKIGGVKSRKIFSV